MRKAFLQYSQSGCNGKIHCAIALQLIPYRSRGVEHHCQTNVGQDAQKVSSRRQFPRALLQLHERIPRAGSHRTQQQKDAYYLPHHGVLRESSTSTKLRVVFNGSQKTSSRSSLNETLHPGPKLQQDLVDVISRWRLYAYAFSCDVEKMYRQILVHPSDRHFQSIWWSEKPDISPESYHS